MKKCIEIKSFFLDKFSESSFHFESHRACIKRNMYTEHGGLEKKRYMQVSNTLFLDQSQKTVIMTSNLYYSLILERTKILYAFHDTTSVVHKSTSTL